MQKIKRHERAYFLVGSNHFKVSNRDRDFINTIDSHPSKSYELYRSSSMRLQTIMKFIEMKLILKSGKSKRLMGLKVHRDGFKQAYSLE